jgi:hypothetical protein
VSRVETPPADATDPPKRSRRALAIAIVLGVVVLAAAAAVLLRPDSSRTLHGTISQPGLCYQFQSSNQFHPEGIDNSMTVTVRDGSDAVIALTRAGERQVLSSDEAGITTPPKEIQGFTYPICLAKLSYSVAIPKTAVYTVQVDGFGASALPTMSYDELVAKHFEVDITLSPLPGST